MIDLRDDTIGEIGDVGRVAQPGDHGRGRGRPQDHDRRRRRRRGRALALLALLLATTTIGLHMRAAAADFETARLLGVRANRVIGVAVCLSGLLAATVAVILTVQFPFVGPDFALRETIVVLVGVVVGGIDRLWTATLGGFAIGFATGVINGVAPDRQDRFPALGRVRARHPRPAPPTGRALRVGAQRRPWSACEAARPARPPAARCRRRSWSRWASPRRSSCASNEIYFLDALVSVAIVVAIYVFVGNSGVLSFGQISFVAVGAFAAGVMTIPLESKTGVLPRLFPLLRDHTIGNARLAAPGRRGGRRLRVPRRPPADAAVRARRRDRDVRRARDHAQPAARVDEDRARRDDALARARDDGRAARRRSVRSSLSPSPSSISAAGSGGCCAPRARTRRPRGVGVSVHRQRLWAFTVSGRSRRLRGRVARARARLDHDGAGLPRAHLRDARDAGRRRRLEPVGCRPRRPRRQRPELVPERGREGRRRSRSTFRRARA